MPTWDWMLTSQQWTEFGVGAAVALLDMAAVAMAVWRGHGVERTLAWILAIIAFPGFGAAAYLLIANPRVRRTTRGKLLAAQAVRECLGVLGGKDGERVHDSCGLFRLAASVTGLPPSSGNTVELLTEDALAFERIGTALRAAKHRILAEYYIIRRDETGSRFLELLAERARAGVEVRLLYDAVGSAGIDGERLAAIVAAGGRAESFLPVNPLSRRWSVHLRNHRKLVSIDGEVGFTGGMNVGDEYSGRARRKGGLHFHDSHLLVRGPAAADLEQVFLEDWSFATEEVPEAARQRRSDHGHPAGSIVAIVPSGPDQEHNASSMLYFAGVTSARQRVYLSSPYFIPDEPMVQALVSAALRGVDVRVLVPHRCDVALVGPAARSYYPSLLRGGVRIFEYLPSMLHAKTIVADGEWGVVGSANLDIRSFRLNFELGAIVADPAFARGLEERFHRDQQNAREVRLADLARRTLPSRLRDGAARLLSPLL